MSPDEFDARVRFVAELARRLHQYGTSAPRLERAIDGVSARLGLLPTSLSTPTSITLSFADPDDGELALPRRTMVMRVNPGDVNLRRLCEVDAIAERVLAQQIGITEGLAELRALRTGLSVKGVGLQVLSFGIAGATVAALLKGSSADVLAAGSIGLLIGLLALVAERRSNFAPSFEAVAAFLAMFFASLIASSLVPLNVRSVLIASIIVLMPGLTLTTAVTELSTQHLVAGTVRLMGAAATLLKLSLGSVATRPCRSAAPFRPGSRKWLGTVARPRAARSAR